MESVIAHAAEVYWESVQVTVDETGVHERYPQTDEEWESVWAAALAIAESGNLLMMTPRAVDDGAWMQFARSLVDAGVEAAAAAASARRRPRVRGRRAGLQRVLGLPRALRGGSASACPAENRALVLGSEQHAEQHRSDLGVREHGQCERRQR